ncbi:hypothetical protein D8B22_22340, partial [Verminephrobacter aporrectodeae subsp. tuberculatae]|uniref:SwmB domain-containing protein n=1 Tax=Verminephrobacter aporrectodeae TaxID=1110389 RepID=UPI002244291E
ASGDFTVLADGSRIIVTGVDVVNGQIGKYILLELATPVVAGQTVTIAYQDSTPTNESAIQDTAGNRLLSFPTTAVRTDIVAPVLITTD